MALSNWIARSVSCASTAVFTRVISRLAVWLRDTTHSAQMRSSIALAVVSSGANLSAPNRKSRLWVRSPRATCGNCFGGSTHLPLPSCATAGLARHRPWAATTAAINKLARNRERMAKESNLSTGEGKFAAGGGRTLSGTAARLALAGLKAGIGLIDDVNAALAPDNFVVPVAGAQRFQ